MCQFIVLVTFLRLSFENSFGHTVKYLGITKGCLFTTSTITFVIVKKSLEYNIVPIS